MTRKYFAISIVLFIMIVSLAICMPFRLNLIPNDTFSCNTCHIVPGGPRNPFGTDWARIAIPAGEKYTAVLAALDSDGDGASNQEEFDASTNPGDPSSLPKKTFKIIASAGPNGNIRPFGQVTVDSGADQDFIISADEGYYIKEILVDGVPLAMIAIFPPPKTITHTFKDVSSDHTIHATFIDFPDLVPDIFVTPNTHSFPDTRVGNPSEPLSIKISNPGKMDLEVSDITLSDTKNFSLDLTNGEFSCNKIAADASCTFSVIFRPLSAGAKEGLVLISSNDPDSPIVSVQLIGAGSGIKGDINNDGRVRSNDAILALRFAAQLSVPDDYQRWSADMNDDGSIKANDAIIILRKASE